MIQIRCIGKLRISTPEAQLVNAYLKKASEKIEVREYVEKKTLSDNELKEAEAQLLLSDMPENAFIVALDEHGQTLS